jgi:hypothetical protein
MTPECGGGSFRNIQRRLPPANASPELPQLDIIGWGILWVTLEAGALEVLHCIHLAIFQCLLDHLAGKDRARQLSTAASSPKFRVLA